MPTEALAQTNPGLDSSESSQSHPCLRTADTDPDISSNFPILTLILDRCTCPEGYTGATCAEDVDECLQANICNNGICRNLEGSFECFCRPGYSGSLCNHEFDECLSNPCLVSPFPPLSSAISNTLTSFLCAAWELHEPGQQLPLRLSPWL